MYSCDRVLAELTNYLDDEVAIEIRRELEVHLSKCRTCQALYDSTRKTLRIVTDSRSFELPENISSRIMTKIMSRTRQTRRGPRRPRRSKS